MPTHDRIRQGREAFVRGAWAEAADRLAAADAEAPLESGDLELLATATYLIGRDAEAADAWTRAHQASLDHGDVERAARCAFWLAFGLVSRGQRAQASGWIARAKRLLDDAALDCVEQGYLLLPVGFERIVAGDAAGALEAFDRAAELAERFGDRDLTALARHSRGRVLIRMGEIAAGVALLDEAMVDVEAEDVSPIVVGDVYCSVIEGCLEIFDLRRAHEWTAVLSRWCEAQPDLVAYRGQCQVRRSTLLQLRGDWPEALDEARRASDRLTRPPGEPAAGEAYYQQAELHRLRGEFDDAERAYRSADAWGRRPEPGMVLLRLAQGRLSAAEGTIRRLLDEVQGPLARSRILPAAVEVLLAAGDPSGARAAAGELSAVAASLGAPYGRAVAAAAEGAVALAHGEDRAALTALRDAWGLWTELQAPYEAARARVLMGRACRRLGDLDGAEAEWDAARSAFERLAARPDLADLEAVARPRERGASHGLTARELEVLRLVAAGETNKSVAARLGISERTVERHLSNIFGKLEVSSRTAATAYAFEHELL